MADLQTEGPLLCSADLQTVSSFVAGLLHSCSATAGFLTNLHFPANADADAGLLVFAFAAVTGRQGLYVSVGLHAFAADCPGPCVAGPAARLNFVPARGNVLVHRLNFVFWFLSTFSWVYVKLIVALY
ncbi:hypothetical protein CRENBAI_025642 [Crenichthys baileyi]|uniref:Uncharacterized protein n=1 Tax=Crenichthys baileyi TaxID=28760 RepID=A0AAV9SK07_9TELE